MYVQLLGARLRKYLCSVQCAYVNSWQTTWQPKGTVRQHVSPVSTSTRVVDSEPQWRPGHRDPVSGEEDDCQLEEAA